MAVLLALSSCSNDENLIVGDSADADGEVSDASVSDGVRLDGLIGNVWLIAEVSDDATSSVGACPSSARMTNRRSLSEGHARPLTSRYSSEGTDWS
jgi:hypothetical protein